MNISYIWPIALVILSNTVYHIAAKSAGDANAFASLSVTYLVGMLLSLALFYITGGRGLLGEIKRVNIFGILLGLSIVGLEAGYIYAYRAGWQVGSAQIVQSAVLAIVLLIVGHFAYNEELTLTKVLGALVCLGGLYLLEH